jgi:NitT/TauT family transport system substrate-binding protein
MNRIFLGGLLILIVVGILSLPAWAQLSQVRISSFDKPSFGHTTAMLIEANKFDRKNGVEIQWDFKPSVTANTDFAAGRDKITLISALLSEANRRLKGVKVVYLFNVLNAHGALLSANPKLQCLKDLEGKTLAANTVTTNYAVFRYFAVKAGVDLNKVKILSTTVPGLVTQLMAKRVDAVQIWEPSYSNILVKYPGRFRMIEYVHQWDAIHGKPQRGFLGVAAHEDWAQENRELIQKVYNAFKDLNSWLPSHQEEAATIVQKDAEISREAFLMALKGNRYRLDVVPAANIVNNIKEVFQAGIESGYMKSLPDEGIIYTKLNG